MLRARHAMLILLPAALVGYAACGGEDPNDGSLRDDIGASEAHGSTAPTIVGTFRDEQSPAGIAVLTLKKDMTYHLEEAVECVKAPCIRPERDGRYKMTTLNGAPVLALYDEEQAATEAEYLRYTRRGEDLVVAPLGGHVPWQTLRRSDQAWCDVADDCALQDLEGGRCDGQWYCATDVCKYTCGRVTCEMEGNCQTDEGAF